MRITTPLVFGLILLAATPSFAQPTPPPADEHTSSDQKAKSAPKPALTKFDLDFPGGTPGELVAAIQKAMKRPLNAIIPTEYANEKLPPLKMSDVDVAQLFRGLYQASLSQKVRPTDGGGLAYTQLSGFKTDEINSLSDNSIWYFHIDGNQPAGRSQPQTRFYLLTPYLEQGLTVDDITTAIKTGWKMLGDPTPPAISFHQETKLLIAVGQPSQLGAIEAALRALSPPAKTKPDPAPTVEEKPAAPPKPAR